MTEGENHSNRRVMSVCATLKQIVVYYARGHGYVSGKVTQKIEGFRIEPGAFFHPPPLFHHKLLAQLE